jgi:hypothetical protein
MPKSNVAIPHFEQVGRLIESECAVAGWYVVIGFPSYLFFWREYPTLSHRAHANGKAGDGPF